MEELHRGTSERLIFFFQLSSVLLIWLFVIAITLWISRLIVLSLELNDAPGASVAISLVAIPVFMTLAGILTYVFVGLQRGKKKV
ncbi:MAG: hypothetical protein A2X67_07245 [Ignavibacteria bacterium GWA2_55_11]|nr:MAG: hypothetical protein A2X67_07245 [Ignavibacteria bacterium GWA2_55_11]OGU43673.1 MAG: hypothetical protein A2X68_06580 [Ignavibacteria bacterium GWC2_56_12]OGU63886.1 MAG: hypothetical protein A3C56_06135 [Ignavibacteria bacterium RIFCSPHIGHO2_02_FULL_56_12]OGU69061.1 MAG: hypothetical protein A3H45_04130 [Ignavibacteria bacterium RIFCSPLOWO2_02_FULL_55_14]OGU76441.1 MAG: hypothetical protein A3G43_00350 [Ignavibacteria bacterium RIFCSPLOWO2_12_FULL_56_21]